MRITRELHQRVDAAFRDAGISIAFPQRDVHFDAGSPIRVSIEKPDH
jgi:potassium efflux system protein